VPACIAAEWELPIYAMEKAEFTGDHTMETVGVYLKREREAKNISLSEVSRLTKISKFYLDYIERDDFQKLPQGPYIKGYISSYSRLIGSNVNQALELYDSLNKKRPLGEDVQPEIQKSKGWKTPIAAMLDSVATSLNKKKDDAVRPAGNRRVRVFNTYSNALKVKTRTACDAIASTLKTKSARFKASVPTQKAIVIPFEAVEPSLERQPNSTGSGLSRLKKVLLAATANVRPIHRRTGLYASLALIGAGTLVLAGVGFYHVFIYDEYPAMPNQAAGRIHSPTSSAAVAVNTPGTEAASDRSNAPAVRTTQTAGPPSRPSPPAENSASHRPATRAASSASAVQRGIGNDPSPGTRTAAVAVNVLKASVCSAIKNRMPAGVDTAFPASVQRVYVWNQIEAKTIPAKIRHIYYFNGRKISDVTLNVRSSFWRTWSYKSMSNEQYRGQWRVDIASADGKVLRRLYFEIK